MVRCEALLPSLEPREPAPDLIRGRGPRASALGHSAIRGPVVSFSCHEGVAPG